MEARVVERNGKRYRWVDTITSRDIVYVVLVSKEGNITTERLENVKVVPGGFL